MNAKKLMNLGGWAALLVDGSLVGYAIMADIPQKAKNTWNSFVEWNKRTNELSLGEKVLIKAVISLL